MRSAIILSVISALAISASARITSIKLGQTSVRANTTANIVFTTNNYVTNWDNIVAAYGVTPPGGFNAGPTSLGNGAVGTVDFLADGTSRTGTGSFVVPVFVSPTVFTKPGIWLINFAVTSTFGAGQLTTLEYFNTTIPVVALDDPHKGCNSNDGQSPLN